MGVTGNKPIGITMNRKIVINNKTKQTVGHDCAPYIIAEIGSNHNGDMEVAKRMIKEISATGAHCAKFQSWTKDTIFSRSKYEENRFLADDYTNRTDYTMEEIVEKFSVSEEELLQLKNLCDLEGLDFASTPFSPKELDFLVDVLDAPFIKVASMDLNNLPFLEKIGSKARPVILSTGLSALWEIDRAVTTLEEVGCQDIVILHCVSTYPPDDADVNLRRMDTLAKAFPYPIGFSDHTLGIEIPTAAVARGACIIEKHFTLDKEMFGWDHKVSTTPEELKQMVRAASHVHLALGTERIKPTESEERRCEFRRSIVVNSALPEGYILTENDVDFKRPGTGIRPDELDYVVGRKLDRDVKSDHILIWEDLV